jgi:hypothetical protein
MKEGIRTVNLMIGLLFVAERGMTNPHPAARKSFTEISAFTSLNARTNSLLNMFVAEPHFNGGPHARSLNPTPMFWLYLDQISGSKSALLSPQSINPNVLVQYA